MRNLSHRLFVAVPLPPSSSAALARAQRELSMLPARWTDPTDRHMTVAFLGMQTDDVLPMILERLEDLVADMSPFEVTCDRVILAPTPDKPKMVWLASDAVSPEMTALCAAVRRVLAPQADSHPPVRPHVTLARLNQKTWKTMGHTVPPVEVRTTVSIPVDAVVLYESVADRGRRIYLPLATVPLGGKESYLSN